MPASGTADGPTTNLKVPELVPETSPSVKCVPLDRQREVVHALFGESEVVVIVTANAHAELIVAVDPVGGGRRGSGTKVPDC